MFKIEMTEDEQFWDEKMMWVWNNLNPNSLLDCPVPCKVALAVYALDGEVLNGGFEQFYFNGNLEYDLDYVKSFEIIGLSKVAKIVKNTIDIYNSIKDDFSKKDCSIEEIYDNNLFGRLNDEYASYDDEIRKSLISYIRENIKYFEK